MENLTPSRITTQLPGNIREQFTCIRRADGYGTNWIAAVSTQNWPELAYLDDGHVVLGDDALIRFALWSASKLYTTLISARRVTLFATDTAAMRKIRCLVVANASLGTPRPLSGFLLQPVEISEACSAASVPNHRMPKEIQDNADETRRALLEAFPVSDDGDDAPTG